MKRYPYICIEGNIGAGKTTLARMLTHEWDAYPIYEQFTDNPFLPLFYKDRERYGFQVELFFMTERHKQMEKIRPRPDLFHQLYVADYFFQKTLLFAQKNLNPEEFRLFKRFFDILERNAPDPDLLIYLHRDVDKLHKQIQSRGREMEAYISKNYLQDIQDAYLEYLRQITHYPVLILEVQNIDFQHNEGHFQTMKEIIEQDYRPGVIHISL